MSLSPYKAIQSVLLGFVPLQSLVDGRIFDSFDVPRHDMGTWIVCSEVSGHEESAHSGNQNLAHPLWQFTIGGNTLSEVRAVKELLVQNFNGESFVYIDDNAQDWELTTFVENSQDEPQTETRVYKASVDLRIWFNY